MAGLRSSNLPLASRLDEVLGHRVVGGERSTVRITISTLLTMLTISTSGGIIFAASKAQLDNQLDYPARTGAYVFDDNPNLRGTYQKQGASGTGSWTRIGDLPTGEPGPAAELRQAGGQLQWRLGDDGDWMDLVSLADLKGPPGSAIELREFGGILQYRPLGEGDWADAYEINVVKGVDPYWTYQDVEDSGRQRFGVANDVIRAPNIGVRHRNGAAELTGPGSARALRAPVVSDARWAWAIVDEEYGRVHFGKRTDGTFYPDLGSGQAAALPVMLNRGALRQFAYHRGRLARGIASKMRVGFIGDSFIASGYRWLAGVLYGTTSLYGRFGDAGAGWVSFVTGNGRPNTGWYVLRRKLASGTDGNAGLQDTDAFWSVQRRNAGNAGPDISSVTPLQASTETDGMFTLTSPADSVALSSFKLVYKAAAACSVRYRWNGGSWTTLALNTSGGPTAVELTGKPATPGWTFDLQAVSGATELYGLMLDGPASGVNVSVMGVNGSSTSDWINNDAATWRQAIALLGIKTYFVMLGTNDQGIPNSPATYIANIQETVARLRTADPACDICILVPPENFDPTRITTPMAGYETAVRDYCAANKTIAALLMQSCCGLPGGDYSASGAFPLWDADTVHPDPNTGGVVMSTFFNTEAVR